ncbi:unnamed protein product [Clavelina lepadiformis]|uniref:Uncharacterized protein n=1 Tax=Clavelina lepadiformis TaxID=159417 RepID=A0ABP0GC52_CLALP
MVKFEGKMIYSHSKYVIKFHSCFCFEWRNSDSCLTSSGCLIPRVAMLFLFLRFVLILKGRAFHVGHFDIP